MRSHRTTYSASRYCRNPRATSRLGKIITFVGLSLLLHVLLLLLAIPLWPILRGSSQTPDNRPVSLVLLEPAPEEQELPEEPPDVRGQIVDLPAPPEEEVPEESDYLAEHDRVVEKETRTERFRVNPKVLAPSFSLDSKLQLKDFMDLNVVEPSTGARVGNDRFEPDRDGNLASLPSPFTLTNKDGLQKPVPTSHRFQDVAGAPNNDLLDEEKGAAVNLNTREFLFAGYINRIRRLVNFYWQQNLDNLPHGLRLAKNRYETVIDVTLTESGAVEELSVRAESGSPPIDNCVVQAFEMAGPFPNPPQQLIDPDGRVQLPHFGFVVQVGQARANYYGVDPRAGVQFPGILKSPR